MEIKPTQRALELLSGEVATEHDMLDFITDLIAHRGTQAAAAKELGVCPVYLNDMLRGKCGLGPKLVKQLGWQPVTVYKKVSSEQ